MRGQIETKQTPVMQAFRRQMQVDLCEFQASMAISTLPLAKKKKKKRQTLSLTKPWEAFLLTLSPPIEKAASGD